jgi:TetR/AcrR family transcriptional repressor of nem operon
MSRYAADHKEKTRARVIELAAQRIRAEGIGGLGVAAVMAEAGLTHGGFYAHFPSRDALLAEAVAHLFDIACAAVEQAEARHGPRALERYVDFYLSPRHRDDASIGCPVPALASEIRHAAPGAREAFDSGLDRLAETLGRITAQSGRPAGRKAGLALLAEMSGALSLSRTIADQKRSGALLADVRSQVLG